MFNRIRSRLPVTMVAETAPIFIGGGQYGYKLVDNIVKNINLTRYLFQWTITWP